MTGVQTCALPIYLKAREEDYEAAEKGDGKLKPQTYLHLLTYALTGCQGL